MHAGGISDDRSVLLLLKFVFALAREMCDSSSVLPGCIGDPLHSFRFLADNLFTALFSYLPPRLPPSSKGQPLIILL